MFWRCIDLVSNSAPAGGAHDNWFYSDDDSFDDYKGQMHLIISGRGISVTLPNEQLSSYSNDDLDSEGL